LNFLAVDPKFQRHGAGSMVIEWGKELCQKDGVPIYLESTVEAENFYQKRGFKRKEAIKWDLDEVYKKGEPIIYQEVCYIFQS
jgi:GNAT superfamily N-acetyltransferase